MTEKALDQYDSIKDRVFTPEHKLLETEHFGVFADDNPLTEGHILIIPNENISCVGEFSDELMTEFTKLYAQMSEFMKDAYGSVSSFEHGKVGQTVYHAHVHMLPYGGKLEDIIPDGEPRMTKIEGIHDVKKTFQKDGQYLFFSIGDEARLVEPNLGYPRFFRDRFASALGKSELGDWKKTSSDAAAQVNNSIHIQQLKLKWQNYYR